MAELQKISTRIKSVKVTRKITKAMELVATSKLRKAKKKFFSNKEYFETIINVFDDISKTLDKSFLEKQMNLDKKTNVKGILYVGIHSDLGLCGAYNSNIAKIIKSELKKEDKIFLIGTKGLSFFDKNKTQIINLENIKELKHEYDDIKKISEDIFQIFKSGNYKKVKLAYTKYINTLNYNPVLVQILPIETQKEKNNNTNLEFEPDPISVFNKALPLYFNSFLYGAIIESYVSEISSRRIAMENATKNADELSEKLLVQYNGIRQSKITQEITEIVAGSESEM